MRDRRTFIKSALALPLARQDDPDKKKYHITLFSGGIAVREWDTFEVTGGSATMFFKDSQNRQIQICGTFTMEEIS